MLRSLTEVDTKSVPTTFLSSRFIDAGVLPAIGLRRYGSLLIQETSRSVAVFGLSLFGTCVVASIAISQSWSVALWLFLFGLCGGVGCLVGVPLLVRRFGLVVIIDLASRQVTLRTSSSIREIALDAVMGTQVLSCSRGGKRRLFQCNLVYRGKDGSICRRALLTTVFRRRADRLARRYSSAAGIPVIDVASLRRKNPAIEEGRPSAKGDESQR